MMAPAHVLPDLLRPGLRVVICGSAAGAVSAARGAYYAGPGNKFWRILAEVGLTPRRLDPGEFREVLNFGIGLTDLVKTHSGSDAILPRVADDVAGLIARIRSVRPRLIAFNGKRAAAAFYGRSGRDVGYGPGPSMADFPPIWVLPSTSGAACGSWSAAPWRRFADAAGETGDEFQIYRGVMQRRVRSVSA
jgi:double-stranded uracil-DNA glycosylase